MEQFAAYEKNYSGGQVITAEEFGNIRMKLEQVQKEIGTAQSELTDTLQALDSNNAKGQESIKIGYTSWKLQPVIIWMK